MEYHDYLGGGKEFLIKTDNIALKYLNSMKHATGRLGRWNLLLSGYKYRVEHTKGQDNVLADRLSRIQLPAPETELEVEVDEMLMNVNKAEAAGMEQIGELWEISTDANTDDDQALNGHTQDVDDTQLDLMTKYNVAEMQENCPDCQPILRFFERRYFA